MKAAELFLGISPTAVADGRGAAILKPALPHTAKAAVVAFADAVALTAGGAVIPAGGGVAVARPDDVAE